MNPSEVRSKAFHQSKRFYASYVEAMNRLQLEETGDWIDLGDTAAVFGGKDSPLTQATGALDDLGALDAFYEGRCDAYEAIVTPMNDPQVAQKLLARGAVKMADEHTLYRKLSEPVEPPDVTRDLTVGVVADDELEVWAEVSTLGFFGEDATATQANIARIIARDATTAKYFAYWNRIPVATASLTIGDGVAVLGGGCTLPLFRERGMQTALIQQRLIDSQGKAEIALLGALPGSTSERNAMRQGFTHAYVETTYRVPVGASGIIGSTGK